MIIHLYTNEKSTARHSFKCIVIQLITRLGHLRNPYLPIDYPASVHVRENDWKKPIMGGYSSSTTVPCMHYTMVVIIHHHNHSTHCLLRDII